MPHDSDNAPVPRNLDNAYTRLIDLLASFGSAAVAFSGGVDSSFLCHAARTALGGGALAVTVVSPMLPRSERDAAREFARRVGITHLLVEAGDIDETIAANPRDRCYHCKKEEFDLVLAAARERGIAAVLDGSNLDDLGDYRPGLRALEELGVRSPLREAGLTKADVRALSRRAGLPTWDKPAYACLASRIPYGERIDAEKLARVERAEEFLRSRGLRQVRVRAHETGGGRVMARIEAAPEERRRFFDEAFLDETAEAFKALGFLYTAFELSGYVTGSLNRALRSGS